MRQLLLARHAFFIVLWLLFLISASLAQELRIESVQTPLGFFTDKRQVLERIEPSAVQPIGDGRLLLIADDKTAELLVVERASGQIKQKLRFRNIAGIPDWEGMARDLDENYYITGSLSSLLRFRLKPAGGDGTQAIDEASVVKWDVWDALVKEGYIKDTAEIEGLAVRKVDERAKTSELIIGIRRPGAEVRVFAANISQSTPSGTKLALRPLFKFDPGKLDKIPSQLSSLEYLPELKGFLILTASEDQANHFHGNTLWFLSDEQIGAALPAKFPPDKLQFDELQLVKPLSLPAFGSELKAEGLCALQVEALKARKTRQVQLVITYDNDFWYTRTAGSFQLLNLTVSGPKTVALIAFE